MKNIQNLTSYKKVYIDFCDQTPPSPQNGNVLPQMVFHNFLTQIEEHLRGVPTRKYTHPKENFVENKLCSYKIFARRITF